MIRELVKRFVDDVFEPVMHRAVRLEHVLISTQQVADRLMAGLTQTGWVTIEGEIVDAEDAPKRPFAWTRRVAAGERVVVFHPQVACRIDAVRVVGAVQIEEVQIGRDSVLAGWPFQGCALLAIGRRCEVGWTFRVHVAPVAE